MKNQTLPFIAMLMLISHIVQAQNTAYGTGAGNAGSYNSSFGYYAGDDNQGDRSCYFGAYTAKASGSCTACFGASAGYNCEGYRNTFIGYFSGYQTSGNCNVFLGSYAGLNQDVSNTLIIDNTSTTSPLIFGDFSENQLSINTSTTGYTLNVNGTIAATEFYMSSDSRFKENATSIDNATDLLNNIKGYTYQFKQSLELPEKTSQKEVPTKAVISETDDSSAEDVESFSQEIPSLNENDGMRVFPEGTQYGMIAQEIQEVLPELVAEDDAGYMSINYNGFIPILVQAVKEISSEKDSLEAELTTENENLQTQLTELSTQYNTLLSEINEIKALLGTVSLSELKKATSSSSDETMEATLKNYPNPFDASTTIEYSIPDGTTAKLLITSIQGKVVKVVEALTQSGAIDLNAHSLSSGTYICALYANSQQLASNTMVVK